MKEEKCWICDGVGFFEEKDTDLITVYHMGGSNIENSKETITRREYNERNKDAVCSGSWFDNSGKTMCSACGGDGKIVFLEDEDLKVVKI